MTRAALIVVGALALPIVVIAWRWQMRTWLDPEPALVLQRDQFRITHKGEHVWIPWTDVADLRIAAPGAGLGRVPALVFELTPGAMTVLPARKAPLADRMFSWNCDALTYARPGDNLPFEQAAYAAGAYLAASRAHGAARRQ